MTDKQAYIKEIRDWCKYADAPMRKAAKWALAEIGRLTTENSSLQSKIDSLTDEVILRGCIIRDLENWEGDDDVKKEAIE